MAARFALAALALLLLARANAGAEQLQRLYVRSFVLASDAARPQLEQPFHVWLTIRVAQNVSQLQNVFLPTFFGAEELGDVQQISHGPSGTTYRETLTLVAHERGVLSISPAYLDAIDARDGKPKRFISNSLRLPVGGGPIAGLRTALHYAAMVVLELVLAAAAFFVVAAIFVRRRRAPAPVREEPVQAAPPPPPAPARDETREAFEQLRARRDRSSVLRVRAALWHAAGASPGETLSDVLARPAAAAEDLRRLLLTVERAAFIEDARLQPAIEEVLCNPRS